MDRRELKRMRDELKEILYSGESKAKHKDRYVEYRDPDEIRRIIADIDAQLSQDSSAKNRTFTICHDTGL